MLVKGLYRLSNGPVATVPAPRYRIGELSRRVGVSPELLRAWETRYRLLRPHRSPGGFRLYGERDELRVRRMRELVGSGVAAAEAARSVLREERTTGRATAVPVGLVERLHGALLAFDEAGSQAALDRLFATVQLETALSEVLLPELKRIGTGWAGGDVTVAQEHFASNLIRARLLGLARGWDEGRGPRAILACLPGEQHDIGLIAFGLVLRRQGWRIVYLGQDAPLETLEGAMTRSQARLVVLSSVDRGNVERAVDQLAPLGQRLTVALGGSGATPAAAARARARLLPPGLIEGARALAIEPR